VKSSPSPSLAAQRAQLADLFDLHSPIDAPTAYYVLYHDPARSALWSRSGEGVVGRFQTGIDLFRPLVTMRCRTPEGAADLLAEALVPGRPYVFFAPLGQLSLIGGSLTINNERILSIYALETANFVPELNVLVQSNTARDGTPRCEIVAGSPRETVAMAGINWQSPGFSELYVQVAPEARQRGWGRSVVTACTGRVLQSGRIPIYLVEPNNEASVKLAISAGYVDTGARQLMADAVYQGHPGRRL
jgi:ribosomal protein S18 acetylase RimI-like enzyme